MKYQHKDTLCNFRLNGSLIPEPLQQDFLALEEWERKWQMKFHPEKCQVIRIITNKRFERQTEYRLHSHALEVEDNGKYLGVTIAMTSAGRTCTEASRTLGLLRRNLGQCTMEVKSTAYTSLVIPVLDYASPA